MHHRFTLYATNLDLPLDQSWNICNTRANCQPRAAVYTLRHQVF